MLIPILDGHNDVISKLLGEERRKGGAARRFFERGTEGHIDLPRAKEGGFAGGLFSIYVSANPQAAPPAGPVLGEHDGEDVKFPRQLELGYAQRTSMAQIGLLFRLQRESNRQLRVVRTAQEIKTAID